MDFKTACAKILSIHPSTTYINLSQIGRPRLSKVYIKSVVPYMEWLTSKMIQIVEHELIQKMFSLPNIDYPNSPPAD